MKMYGEVDIEIHVFSISAGSRTDRFTSGERGHDVHWTEDYVRLRAGLNDVEKRRYHLNRGSNSDLLNIPPHSQQSYPLRSLYSALR
jgi:hypothetical protein